MNYIFRTFVFTALVTVCFIVAIDGQTAKSDERTDIVVVDQPDCPMRLVPAQTAAAPTRLRFSNVGDQPVRAFVLVTEHPQVDRLQVHLIGRPYEPKKETNSHFGPLFHTRLYFDYVLYADGTSWGPDKFERSKEIAHFFSAQATAIERLAQLAAAYPNPNDFLNRIDEFGAATSFDTFGPPKPHKLEQHERNAWDQVIRVLRRNNRRSNEAGEIADQLEKEKPGTQASPQAKGK